MVPKDDCKFPVPYRDGNFVKQLIIHPGGGVSTLNVHKALRPVYDTHGNASGPGDGYTPDQRIARYIDGK